MSGGVYYQVWGVFQKGASNTNLTVQRGLLLDHLLKSDRGGSSVEGWRRGEFWQYFWSIFIFLCSLASNHRIKMLQAASLHSSKDSTARLSVAKVSTKSDVSLVSPTLDSLIIETQFANFKSKERRGSFSQREKLSLIKSPRNRKSSKSVIRMAFKSLKLS